MKIKEIHCGNENLTQSYEKEYTITSLPYKENDVIWIKTSIQPSDFDYVSLADIGIIPYEDEKDGFHFNEVNFTILLKGE